MPNTHFIPAVRPVAILATLTLTLMSSPDHAQLQPAIQLVQALTKRDGHPELAEKFDSKLSYGGTAIEFDRATRKLVVRAFVSRTWWKTATDEQKENFRKTLKGLNDPKIGGMYERGGGYFVFDEAKGYYLCRDFQVDQTTPKEFVAGVEFLRTVAARWTTEWMFEVAQAVHGHREPPDKPVKYTPK